MAKPTIAILYTSSRYPHWVLYNSNSCNIFITYLFNFSCICSHLYILSLTPITALSQVHNLGGISTFTSYGFSKLVNILAAQS